MLRRTTAIKHKQRIPIPSLILLRKALEVERFVLLWIDLHDDFAPWFDEVGALCDRAHRIDPDRLKLGRGHIYKIVGRACVAEEPESICGANLGLGDKAGVLKILLNRSGGFRFHVDEGAVCSTL